MQTGQQPPLTGSQFSLVILAVRDVPRSAAFYDAAFSWPKSVSVPVYVEYRITATFGVGLYQREGFSINTGGAQTVEAAAPNVTPCELYLRCLDLSDIHNRVLEAGARLLSPPSARSWGEEAAYYADPDGHVIALARPITPKPEK